MGIDDLGNSQHDSRISRNKTNFLVALHQIQSRAFEVLLCAYYIDQYLWYLASVQFRLMKSEVILPDVVELEFQSEVSLLC